MAYDFAKRKKKRRKKTPTKTVSGRPKWFAAGVISGLFLAFLLNLAGVNFSASHFTAEPKTTKHSSTKTNERHLNTEPAKTKKERKTPPIKPQFDFYDVLPERQIDIPPVTVPTEERRQPPTKSSNNTIASSYLIQAGSFTTHRDADRQRAEILLLDIHATVEPFTQDSGKTLYRVYVGPFGSNSTMEQTRNKLRQANIKNFAMKRD